MSPVVRNVLTIALLLLGVWFYETMKQVYQPPGVLAPEAPSVRPVADKPPVYERNGHVLTGLAGFSAHARVLSLDRYTRDRAARVAPLAIVLGWGPLSDSSTLKVVDIAQTERRVLFKSYDPKLGDDQVGGFLLNLHVIAADPQLEERLAQLRAGNLVRIEGWLVEAAGDDGWRWRGETRERPTTVPGTLLWVQKLDVS